MQAVGILWWGCHPPVSSSTKDVWEYLLSLTHVHTSLPWNPCSMSYVNFQKSMIYMCTGVDIAHSKGEVWQAGDSGMSRADRHMRGLSKTPLSRIVWFSSINALDSVSAQPVLRQEPLSLCQCGSCSQGSLLKIHPLPKSQRKDSLCWPPWPDHRAHINVAHI